MAAALVQEHSPPVAGGDLKAGLSQPFGGFRAERRLAALDPGRYLLVALDRVFASLNQAHDELMALKAGGAGQVNIGAITEPM